MPFEYRPQWGSGLVTFVSANQAYIRPDDNSTYGRELRAYPPKYCSNAPWNSMFQLGDRVDFRYKLSSIEKWVAVSMKKAPRIPGEIIQIPNGIMPSMKGEIVEANNGYAFIDLDKNYCGRIHMGPESVSHKISRWDYTTDGKKDYCLVKAFPVGTRVVFDLHQCEHGYDAFKAKNVRIA